MYWLFLLLAIAAFVFALSATKVSLLLLALFVSLVFFLMWVRGLYVARFGSVVNDGPRVLHPAELQRMREQLRPAAPMESAPAPEQRDS
ncbi:hypothetical protein [Stenotrophomonas sp. Marseille-Q4652]|uniref:hypothetical protein n=1 Tax=Stenotrophomonas sp. Marseille-Q4652 TaxID=2866595 RepID=UPI001CE4AE83|nr:hypothetical protein [Stenotrophomonas sp. Marseille-Q4652]